MSTRKTISDGGNVKLCRKRQESGDTGVVDDISERTGSLRDRRKKSGSNHSLNNSGHARSGVILRSQTRTTQSLVSINNSSVTGRTEKYFTINHQMFCCVSSE